MYIIILAKSGTNPNDDLDSALVPDAKWRRILVGHKHNFTPLFFVRRSTLTFLFVIGIRTRSHVDIGAQKYIDILPLTQEVATSGIWSKRELPKDIDTRFSHRTRILARPFTASRGSKLVQTLVLTARSTTNTRVSVGL